MRLNRGRRPSDVADMRSRDRVHPRRRVPIAAIVFCGIVLSTGWSIGPARSRADIDRPRHLVVREVGTVETSLGTLHGRDRSTRLLRGDHGLRFEVLDATGTVIAVFDDHPGVDSDLAAIDAPNPRRGFAGVDELRIDSPTAP